MHYAQDKPAGEPAPSATAEDLRPAADHRPEDDRPADDELADGESDRASQAATHEPRPDLAGYEPL